MRTSAYIFHALCLLCVFAALVVYFKDRGEQAASKDAYAMYLDAMKPSWNERRAMLSVHSGTVPEKERVIVSERWVVSVGLDGVNVTQTIESSLEE